MRYVLVGFLALFVACVATGGAPPPRTNNTNPRPRPIADEPAPTPKREAKPAGASCLAAAECESGTCEDQGCGNDAPGTCAPAARGCTRDARQYCGCDGKTFTASGSCPGQRFSAKTACP